MATPYKRNDKSGNVLVEFAFAMPLLLALFAGLVELGSLLAQYLWIQQVSYNAAFVASGLLGGDSSGDPSEIVNTLYKIHNSDNRMYSQYYLNSVFNPASDTVTVELKARMNPMTGITPFAAGRFHLDIGTLSSSPAFDLNSSGGTSKRFANSGNYYDCDGSPLATPPVSCP
ncbi:MAG: pilus assembly protein [Candidatus Dadabacteria bacterium]|nr:MAG: pilus assembly protein [Candidatus Dadabacteria bacterium]